MPHMDSRIPVKTQDPGDTDGPVREASAVAEDGPACCLH